MDRHVCHARQQVWAKASSEYADVHSGTVMLDGWALDGLGTDLAMGRVCPEQLPATSQQADADGATAPGTSAKQHHAADAQLHSKCTVKSAGAVNFSLTACVAVHFARWC